MADDRTFVPLKKDDYLVIMVRRKRRYKEAGEQTLEYYGLGLVLTVDLRGSCLTYQDWKGGTQDVAKVDAAGIWTIDALTVAGDAMWGAWKAREGAPFVTMEGVTAFVRDFRLRTLAERTANRQKP
jgi:hypothetical protein